MIYFYRLAGIKNRAVKLQGKLDHLQNNLSQKAVKLYSAAKYPSNNVYREYPIVVRVPSKREEKPPTVYKSSVPIAQESKLNGILGDKTKSGRRNGDVNIQEKLQFYHVKSKPKERNEAHDPRRITVLPNYVGSLLLDDGKDSQYKLQSKSLLSTNEKKGIEDAPDSILQSWHQTDLESPSNYFYAPTLGEVRRKFYFFFFSIIMIMRNTYIYILVNYTIDTERARYFPTINILIKISGTANKRASHAARFAGNRG